MTQRADILEPTGLELPSYLSEPSGEAAVPLVLGPVYFKRYKMEAVLVDAAAPEPPAGCTFVPWSPTILEAHAETLFASFAGEIDTQVFASLGDREGCRSLMKTIAERSNFVPESTWLLVGRDGAVGSVQGLCERRGVGAIQNVGIIPACRGRGYGELLVRQALSGFRAAGLKHAVLEVTATNERAVRLYRRLGFRRAKTLYKTRP